MDASLNGYIKQTEVVSKWYWFTGDTALKEGQGLCTDVSVDAATEPSAKRANSVALPAAANADFFVGVAARNYSAKPNGQLVEVYAPGSTCKILAKADVVLGGTITCLSVGADAGKFTSAGTDGEGTASVLQTVDAAASEALCLARLQVGPPSGLVAV